MLAESLESGDEAFDLAIGVAEAEVVAAGIAVQLAGLEHVSSECLTVPSARLWPRRGRSRWYARSS